MGRTPPGADKVHALVGAGSCFVGKTVKYTGWRVAVVVYPGGLENLCPSGLTGSNPVPSADGGVG